MSQEETLQPAEVNEVNENESINPVESSNEGADLAPATEPEKVEFSDEQQKVFNGVVGKKTKQVRDAERESDDLREQLKNLQSQIPAEKAPSIPDLPDKYDFDSDQEYFAAITERDNKIRQTVEFESKQSIANAQQAQNEQNALMEQQQRQQDSSNELVNRAVKNGITQEDIFKAASSVGQYRLSPDIGDALVNDKDGDIMIMHLANNPLDADELSRMNLFEASRMIDTVIREKAQKYKLSSSKAPDPSTEIKGNGNTKQQDGILAGVTFT